ncbi:hypothetical protein [Bradyrhizobium sp. JYMT SZCCT0428]|uniref:hypothetical protein n=1 Tax=Bradyrhizobium sp. JYMT SZCCT0428 TaxID=2807673 RepID=UPI001BAB89DF|nr:hypothetical protein [Bradyrhizobium sp. JYMT SZCCT0428]MBR1154306.1 hypothetical protein [Bradyrhizobium sp. JYMT SZCCT0428]
MMMTSPTAGLDWVHGLDCETMHRIVDQARIDADASKIPYALDRLKEIWAIWHVEDARASPFKYRPVIDARIDAIRNQMQTVRATLDNWRSNMPDPEEEKLSSLTFKKLEFGYNLWKLKQPPDAKSSSFYELVEDIVQQLNLAEQMFAYLDKLQTDFDSLNGEHKSSVFFGSNLEQNAHLAFQGLYPYLLRYNYKTPALRRMLPQIGRLYEFLTNKKFTIAKNPDYTPGDNQEKNLKISQYSSPALRFAYTLLRECGLVSEVFDHPEPPCRGEGFRRCTDELCEPCRALEVVAKNAIGHLNSNLRKETKEAQP